MDLIVVLIIVLYTIEYTHAKANFKVSGSEKMWVGGGGEGWRVRTRARCGVQRYAN